MKKIIGYHINKSGIYTSKGESCLESPFLDFLLQPEPDTIKVFYHMEYSISNLLILIGVTREEAEKLQHKNYLHLDAYTLKYIPGKYFSIAKGHYYKCPFVNFSDVNQYSSAKLENVTSKEACLAAALNAQETGEEVYKTLTGLGLNPTSLTSPIKVYEKEVLDKIDLPTIDDIPEDAGFYAYQTCQGNWVETFQIGHWETAYDYDINSAYPSELAKLVDIRLGKWKESKQWIPEAKYGYCKGIVTITEPYSPITYNVKGSGFNNLNYTPVGEWETFLTKEQIEFIYKWKLGKFELINGWWWIPEKESKLLEDEVTKLYLQKEQSKGLSKKIIKRTASGIWGKFLQVQKDGFGDKFNPVYGAEVETAVKLRVSDFVLRNRINPISIAVDGVISPKVVNDLGNENEIGRWKLTDTASCISVGTATVAMKGKEKNADFSLSYKWLMEEIKRDPKATEYSMKKMSPVTLAVALNGNWEKLGELREITKTVYIGNNVKRQYKKTPEYGEDLLNNYYKSEPWDITVISNPVEEPDH